MKHLLLLLCFLPFIAFGQPGDELYLPDMEPIAPDMPVGSFDLNGDSIPELTFSHYVVGTDDVPSSSGSWSIVVLAEKHCEILYENRSGNSWGGSLYWLQPQDTIPVESSPSMIWQKRGVIEFLTLGYGGSATDGWVRVYEDASNRIGIRFTQEEKTWIGWVKWGVEPGSGKVWLQEGEVWLLE